jgi:hypothetical protein
MCLCATPPVDSRRSLNGSRSPASKRWTSYHARSGTGSGGHQRPMLAAPALHPERLTALLERPQIFTARPAGSILHQHAADSLASVDRSCLRCGCSVDRLWQVSGARCRAAVHAQPKGQRPASDAVLGRTGLMPTWRLSGSGRPTTARASPPAFVYQIDVGRRRLHNRRRTVVADGTARR